MSFSLVNPTGWTVGDLLTEDQINQLDADHAHAVDGSGGAYVLTSPLSFHGDSFSVDELQVDATFAVVGVATFNSDVNFAGGGATFAHTAVFNHDVQIGNTSGDSLSVTATSNFAGPATFNQLTATGNTVIGNSAVSDVLQINAVVSLLGVVQPSGTGRILEYGIDAPNADASIDITSYRYIYIPATVTGSRLYTLTSTGTVFDGDWVRIQNDDSSAHTITGLIGGSIAAGVGVKYVFIGGVWRMFT